MCAKASSAGTAMAKNYYLKNVGIAMAEMVLPKVSFYHEIAPRGDEHWFLGEKFNPTGSALRSTLELNKLISKQTYKTRVLIHT
jgi:hypothetical protein